TGLTQVNDGTLRLDTIAASAVQTVTVTGASGQLFTLSLPSGTPTGSLDPGSATLASDIRNALDAVLPPGGSVMVSQAANVYTVTFGGSLANQFVPQLVVGGPNPASAAVATVVRGNSSIALLGDLMIGN